MMKKTGKLKNIIVPADYDYVGIYLTDKCFLRCPYCLTNHHGADFIGRKTADYLSSEEWIRALNRLVLPENVPITLQGGEPFLYPGIWEILDKITHKVDIMTALPPFLKKKDFLKLKKLDWNKRQAPYPSIRVSYHKGQNDFKELVDRIAELDDLLSIGLYYLNHPEISEAEIRAMKDYAKEKAVEFRAKEFLGVHRGKTYGTIKYPDAVAGKVQGRAVHCKNTVVPVAPNGEIYLCHSDLYFNRRDRSLGNILDDAFTFPDAHLLCLSFGLCSECDVKIKTNHYQEYGYTSVNIRFPQQETLISSAADKKEQK